MWMWNSNQVISEDSLTMMNMIDNDVKGSGDGQCLLAVPTDRVDGSGHGSRSAVNREIQKSKEVVPWLLTPASCSGWNARGLCILWGYSWAAPKTSFRMHANRLRSGPEGSLRVEAGSRTPWSVEQTLPVFPVAKEARGAHSEADQADGV